MYLLTFHHQIQSNTSVTQDKMRKHANTELKFNYIHHLDGRDTSYELQARGGNTKQENQQKVQQDSGFDSPAFTKTVSSFEGYLNTGSGTA